MPPHPIARRRRFIAEGPCLALTSPQRHPFQSPLQDQALGSLYLIQSTGHRLPQTAMSGSSACPPTLING